MRTIKKIITSLLIVLVLAFIGFLVLPLDTFFAVRSAEMSGYDVSGSYEDINNRYYYNNLSETEKTAYSIICAQITEFPKEILIPDLTDNELKHVFEAVSYDNPEFFFLGNRCSVTGLGSLNYFIPQYAMSQNAYKNKMIEVNAVTNEILSRVSLDAENGSPKDVYNAELYIHDLIAGNCEYTEETDNITCSVYGALVDGKASCEGYARSLQYLLGKIGVVNYVVTGEAMDQEGNKEGHMWNVVTIDGKQYNVDATWDDYSVSEQITSPDNSASHTYFNIPKDRLSFTHIIDNENAWAGCTTDEINYFEINGLLFSEFNNETMNVLRQKIANKLTDGNRSIEICFANKEAYDTAVKKLFDNSEVYRILKTANMVAPASNKINTNKIQYTTDENLYIIRMFFVAA